jgi:glucose-1-phosphate adenylyltransferase
MQTNNESDEMVRVTNQGDEMMQANIVILAGGVSSRMKKALANAADLDPSLLKDAQQKSKSMIGVGRDSRPFLDYLLDTISQAAYQNVVIVVGERDNSIREYYERGESAGRFPGLKISYAIQSIPAGREKPLGTADALLQALKSMPAWKGQHLTVCNSDNLYSVKALKLIRSDTHENAMIDYDRSALQFEQERIEKFAVIQKDAQGFLVDIIEKPTPEQIARASDARGRIGVSMNLFRFSYDMIHSSVERVPLNQVRQEKELPAAVMLMIGRHPRSMFTIPLSEHVPDLTSPADILRVRTDLERGGMTE